MSFALWFVFFYVLGGITLIPLLALAVLLFFHWTLPQVPPDQDPNKDEGGLLDSQEESQDEKSIKQSTASSIADQSTLNSSSSSTTRKSTSFESENETGVDAYFSGTVVVSREYFIYPTGGPNNSGNPPAPASHQASMNQSESAYSSLYKLFSNSLKPGASSSSSASSTHSTISPSPSFNDSLNDPSFLRKNSSLSTFSTTSASSASSTASNSSASSSTSKKTKLLKYHAVLRHGNLFLYEDSDHQNMKHVIVIAHHLVTIWPPNLPDGELFAKRNAICLLKIPYSHGSPAQSDLDIAELLSDPTTPPKDAFYLYTDSASEKEDFYFALLRASKRHPLEEVKDPDSVSRFDPVYLAHPIRHKTSEIMDLIQTLHATDSNIQTRWLNALIGRIFLSVKDTPNVSNFWIKKISTKLTRIKKPTFLGDIHVTRLSTGSSLPYFTNPKLIELTPEGKLTIETDVSYSGQFCVQITTKVLLNLGQRFKAREVTVALAITLQHLEGKLIIRVKPPPSDRIWYTFESMPRVSLLVEPIVSSRQVTYSFVTKAIENKIRDTVSIFFSLNYHHYTN